MAKTKIKYKINTHAAPPSVAIYKIRLDDTAQFCCTGGHESPTEARRCAGLLRSRSGRSNAPSKRARTDAWSLWLIEDGRKRVVELWRPEIAS